MTRAVVVVDEWAPFKEIARLMQEYRVSALPVVRGDGRLVGIVSEADLLLKEGRPEGGRRLLEGPRRRLEREKAEGLVASQLMTTPVVITGPDASLSVAARLMHRRGVKRVPVVDEEGRVVGIVSRADLLKVFLRPDDEIEREVSEDVIRRALWIDPDRVRVRVRDGVVTLEGQLERRGLIRVLVEMVRGVDGVVGVQDRLSYELDNDGVRSEGPWPWVGLGTPRS